MNTDGDTNVGVKHYTAAWLKSRGWVRCQHDDGIWWEDSGRPYASRHFYKFHEAIRIEKQREQTPCE